MSFTFVAAVVFLALIFFFTDNPIIKICRRRRRDPDDDDGDGETEPSNNGFNNAGIGPAYGMQASRQDLDADAVTLVDAESHGHPPKVDYYTSGSAVLPSTSSLAVGTDAANGTSGVSIA